MKTTTQINAAAAITAISSCWIAAVALGLPVIGWAALIAPVVVTVAAVTHLTMEATSENLD